MSPTKPYRVHRVLGDLGVLVPHETWLDVSNKVYEGYENNVGLRRLVVGGDELRVDAYPTNSERDVMGNDAVEFLSRAMGYQVHGHVHRHVHGHRANGRVALKSGASEMPRVMAVGRTGPYDSGLKIGLTV
ncbi:hypothetical protein JB92DRAFT_2825906 [Gautieria morchelliformis]|nr:hypothetical protein JB92DRAFT_2825906 [Gautieria morchelliformis]